MNNNLVELPSYEFDPVTGLAPDAVAAYERDGVVSLRHTFNETWIELLAEGMEIAIKDGYQRNTAFNIATPGEPGFFFYDTFMWKRIDNFRMFIFDSNVSEVAATIMQSKSLIFYFDFMNSAASIISPISCLMKNILSKGKHPKKGLENVSDFLPFANCIEKQFLFLCTLSTFYLFCCG